MPANLGVGYAAADELVGVGGVGDDVWVLSVGDVAGDRLGDNILIKFKLKLIVIISRGDLSGIQVPRIEPT